MAQVLRDASLQAFDALIELVQERDAAFLLLAGDLYDGAERGVRAQLRLHAGLRRLAERGVPSFLVHGNHDPMEEGWSALDGFPAEVTVFGSDAVGSVPVLRDGECLATVHGRSYAVRETCENLALGFARGDAPGLHIGLLHCNVGGAREHAPYSPCTQEELIRARLDYWALGHVHGHQVVRAGEPWIVYPGNLQGRSLRSVERGPKGACVVEVESGRVMRVDHVALDRVRFAELELSLPEQGDLADLEAALREAGEALHRGQDGRALVLRAVLTGRAPLHAAVARPGVCETLLAGLREAAAEVRPVLWWDALEDRSRAPLDRPAILARDDFSAALLREHERAAADANAPPGLPAEVYEPLERLTSPWLPAPDATSWAAERAEAEQLALDALEQLRESEEARG